MSETKHPTKTKKPNPIADYLESSVQEIRKVTWPTRQQAVRMTVLVIGFCLVAALILGAVDFVFNFGYRKLIEVSPAGSQPSILDQLPETTVPTSLIGDEVQVNNVSATDADGQPVTITPAVTDSSSDTELVPRTIQPAEQPTGTQQ
ncbi:preprotein translocase subunit SecE [Candidatus Peregrinibacteria bacterium]|nr:preprotein translocase subunit SecE [Candidatus Peregrinibacteria bacterium]